LKAANYAKSLIKAIFFAQIGSIAALPATQPARLIATGLSARVIGAGLIAAPQTESRFGHRSL
jgi:hypothetical protein